MARVWQLPTLGGKQFWGDVLLRRGFRIQRRIDGRHRLLDPRDRRLAVGDFAACRRELEALEVPPDDSRHLVLLLHGIFRSKDAFAGMTRGLRAEGYDVYAVNYPSTRQSIDAHADQLDQLLGALEGVQKVSLVGHSLGGIVIRALLGRRQAAWQDRISVNRAVLIGSPNRGARIAQELVRLGATARLVAGPALGELVPETIDAIPPLTVPFGLVAGGTGTDRGFNPLLPGDNDMTVTVDETYLEGAEDRLLVRAVHTFIMVHPEVVAGTAQYLRTGSFSAHT